MKKVIKQTMVIAIGVIIGNYLGKLLNGLHDRHMTDDVENIPVDDCFDYYDEDDESYYPIDEDIE